MGIVRSEDELATLCRTSTAGTSPANLLRGLRQVTGAPSPIREWRSDVAMLRLMAALREGHPCILCVDDYEHWVAAVGLLGNRVLIADSADNELVTALGLDECRARWEGPGRPAFVGIIL